MKKTFLYLIICILIVGCAPTDPLEEELQNKENEISGVWIWISTKYPTPFGSITVSPVNTGVVYKVVVSGNKAEVFRQNYLVQKFTFEISRNRDDYFLDVLTKEEVEYSSIDMLGGKISLDERELTLSFDTQIFRSDMLLSRAELF